MQTSFTALWDIVELFLLIGLIFLNGLFAMSEIALVTARKPLLNKQAESGHAGAKIALNLGKDPTQFLSTIQVGITSIGILSGIIGEAALSVPVTDALSSFGLPEKSAAITATALVVIAVTYVSIVVGELVPKRLGQTTPETIARLVARPIHYLSVIARPFVWLLSFSTHGLLRLMGLDKAEQPAVTEEEIHAMLEEGSESGVIEQQQHDIVRNVFRLDDRLLGSLMIPRSDVVFLDLRDSLDEILRKVIESGHSHFPVCSGGLDHILGTLHVGKILAMLRNDPEKIDLNQGLTPCVFVPETLTAMALLEHFRTNPAPIVFIIDEYGEVDGIVSLHDLFETMTGELYDDVDDAKAICRKDGSWLLDGAISILDMKDCLELKTVPEEDKGRYQTLGGMILLVLGRLPQEGDILTWDGWQFEVIDMDKKRIDKVLASPAPALTGDEPNQESSS